MLLQKMNTVLIRHGKIFFGIFTFIIIICFVYYFSPGVSGDLFFSGGPSQKAKYGSFMDETITYGDFYQAKRELSLVQMATAGTAADVSDNAAFQFAALLKAADKFGATLSNQELVEAICAIPTFQTPDGKYSKEMYEAFRKSVLAPRNIGVQEFETALANFFRVRKMMSDAADGVVLTDSELETLAAGMLETFTYRLVTFSPDDFLPTVSATDQETEAFFKSNGGKYLTDAKNSGLLAVAPYAITVKPVTEKQVSDFYELNKDSYKTPDGKFKEYKEVSASIRKALETSVDKTQATAKMREFYKILRDARSSDAEEFAKDPGKIFVDAAKRVGLKVVSVQNVTEKTQPATELDAAAIARINSMKTVGTFSSVIPRESDSAVFLLTARENPQPAPFASVKEQVKKDLLAQKARNAMEETLKSLRLKFEESKNPSAEIEKLVADARGKIEKPATGTREILMFAYDPAIVAMMNSKPGSLTQPFPTLQGAKLLFLESRAPATKERIHAAKDGMRPILLGLKRDAVQRDFASWVLSNCTILAEEANKADAPRPDQPVRPPANPL